MMDAYGPPRPSPDHIVGFKNLNDDNSPDNLEWVTKEQRALQFKARKARDKYERALEQLAACAP